MTERSGSLSPCRDTGRHDAGERFDERLFPVAERFVSVNGEGVRSGRLATFVRFAGCNLACSYCDTAWANDPACPCEMMDVGAIAAYVAHAGTACVTLTGGEPLLQPCADRLIEALLDLPPASSTMAGRFVEVETNGSVDIAPFARVRRDRDAKTEARGRLGFTLDCKLPSSGMAAAMLPGNYAWLTKDDTVKFVVGTREDLLAMERTVREHGLCARCPVYVSPVFGMIDPAAIVEFMKERGLVDVTLQLQLHKVIWPRCEKGV